VRWRLGSELVVAPVSVLEALRITVFQCLQQQMASRCMGDCRSKTKCLRELLEQVVQPWLDNVEEHRVCRPLPHIICIRLGELSNPKWIKVVDRVIISSCTNVVSVDYCRTCSTLTCSSNDHIVHFPFCKELSISNRCKCSGNVLFELQNISQSTSDT
jgi:hypothetical protein